MKISRELKTGIIALVAIAVFIWGFSYLKGKQLFDTSVYYYAEYDNVQGLEVSGPVTTSGYKIGKVDQIYFHPNKPGKLVVKFSLDKPFKFSKNSVAEIYSPSLISGKGLNLIPVYGEPSVVKGDTIKSALETGLLGTLGDKVGPLEGKISSFLTDTDTLINNFNQILDADGKNNLKQSLASLNSTLKSFRSASQSLNAMLSKNGKIDSILSNANVASKNLVNLTDSLNNSNLQSTIARLETTLNSFNGLMTDLESGKGTMGKILKDEQLYKNLEGATKELELLLRDFKQNPKRFVHFSVFGKKNKPYKSTETDSIN